jgi:hypothetical protein
MTSTAKQQPVSTEEIKQAIIALIKENNAEFKQLLAELLPNLDLPTPKKAKNKTESKIEFPPKKERIPYSEMPFWKANPDLKPLEGPSTPNQKAFLEAILAFATNPETQLTDEMIEGVDDDI